jgi:hypothetical protein
MFTKWFSFTVMIALLAATAACAPAGGGEGESVSVQNDGTTVEMVPAPENPSNEAGSAEPGAAAGETAIDPSQQDAPQPSGTSIMYTDDTYKFAVEYPSDFTFGTQPAEKLASLDPKPLASFIFMNPQAASSDIVELEPADLEIRIYDAQNAVSLEHWRASTNLGGEGYTSQEFKTTNISGLRVCASSMIFPACSYLVIGDNLIYQLIPVNLEGEDMVKSFMLIR